MDVKMVESVDKDDPSADTLRLTTQWKEITKPVDYRFTQRQWRKYTPPRTLRAEQKRIEVESWQKRNKIIWQRTEINSRETQKEADREKEFHIKKSETCQRDTRQELAVATRNNHRNRNQELETQRDEIETMLSDSDRTLAVPAINFKRYLGATSVRYIQVGTASKVQYDNQWDLEETVRQKLGQKFSPDIRTIADETTNDDKLLKTLVSLERKNLEQTPDKNTDHKKNLSTRFGVVFYDNKFVVLNLLKQAVIMLLHKGYPEINKMNHAARLFWWPKLIKDIQAKCSECIPCQMSGKSIKPQLPMTEINFLPPVEKLNQEFQLDFI